MAKNICINLKFSFQDIFASGAVVEYWAAGPKDLGSPPAVLFSLLSHGASSINLRIL
jgi:hypothetical protein